MAIATIDIEELLLPEMPAWQYREMRKRDNHYTKGQLDFIARVEQEFTEYRYTGDFTPLFTTLKTTVAKKSKALERRWRDKRIYADDFESAMWEAVYKVADSYDWFNSEYWVYETLVLAMKRKCIDLVRTRTRTLQGKLESSVLPLFEDVEVVDPVDEVSNVDNLLFLEQLGRSKQLSAVDVRLAKLAYEDPSLSLRELGEKVGRSHEWVRGAFKRLQTVSKQYLDA